MAVLGGQFSWNKTSLFYSLSGIDSDQVLNENIIALTADTGAVVELEDAIQLLKTPDLEIGVMNFGARPHGAAALFLDIRSLLNKVEVPPLLFVKFDGLPTQDRSDLTSLIRREGLVDQTGYLVGLNLWLAPPEKISLNSTAPDQTTALPPAITPTPLQIGSWTVTPTGVEILNEISFIIEDIKNQQETWGGVQLLSDGSAVVVHSGSAVIVQPVQVIEREATPQPYP